MTRATTTRRGFGEKLTVALAAAAFPVFAQQAPPDAGSKVQVITLGTAGGPRPRADRSQAANLLVVDGTPYLIDAGEGAIRQIARAGVDFRDIGQVFITHNHSDHTLGLPAVLATQWEFQRRDLVTIHGPRGLRMFVDGMIAFLSANTEIRSAEGFPQPFAAMIGVNEAETGVIFQDGKVRVTAVQNTHYNFPATSRPAGRHVSFSYRFDTPKRSVVFTGDTGPSAALTDLARGADVLVTEVSDPQELVALYRRQGLWDRKTAQEQAQWLWHQEEEHLTPEAVGRMATTAGVKMVVLTHFPPSGADLDDFARRVEAVKKGFGGPVFAARDLDRF